MNLTHYRNSNSEKIRISNLMSLVPSGLENALDIGARDGYLSKQLTAYFDTVVALDLEKPDIINDKIEPKEGDITQLDFADSSFNFVLCAEVLEHIPSHLLEKACQELARVADKYLLVGVPYEQDIRVGRTTCFSCGGKNPPWGHINTFNEKSFERLFPSMNIEKIAYVGESNSRTNIVSVFLYDLANNPYGTYNQEEVCIHCSKKLILPPERSFQQKVFSKIAANLNSIQAFFIKSKPNWIHVLLKKP